MTRPPPTRAPRCERSEEIDGGRMPGRICIAKAGLVHGGAFVRISEEPEPEGAGRQGPGLLRIHARMHETVAAIKVLRTRRGAKHRVLPR